MGRQLDPRVARELARQREPISQQQPVPAPAASVPPPVWAISDSEALIGAGLSESMDAARAALARVGNVGRSRSQEPCVTGTVAHGLHRVHLRVSFAQDQRGTRVVVQARGDDAWGTGAKSAARRFLETLRNLNNPGYLPDRLGMSVAVLVAQVLAIIVVCGLIGWLVSAFFFQ